MRNFVHATLWMCLATILATDASAQQLGKRYEDLLNGYSIRPPADARRVANAGEGFLARWMPESFEGEDVPWTITIRSRISQRPDETIRTYSEVNINSLSAQPGVKVATPQFAKIQGFDVVQVTGVMTGRLAVGVDTETRLPDVDIYQLIVLLRPPVLAPASDTTDKPVVLEPAQFLDLKLMAETRLRSTSRTLWTEMVRSLTLVDPAEAARKHEQAAQRTRELLWPTANSDEHNTALEQLIRKSLPTQPVWWLAEKNGRPIGWVLVQGRTGRSSGKSGFLLKTWTMTQMPQMSPQMVLRTFFITPDLAIETWESVSQVGTDTAARTQTESVQRQSGQFFWVVGRDARGKSTDVPIGVMSVYLPKLLSLILPRILDLNTPGSYIFGEFNPSDGTFEMRSVEVIGPDVVTTQGKTVKAIHLKDIPTAQSDPTHTWVDSEGVLLKSELPDGTVITAVDEAALLRAFPQAKQIAKQLNKLEKTIQNEPVIPPNFNN